MGNQQLAIILRYNRRASVNTRIRVKHSAGFKPNLAQIYPETRANPLINYQDNTPMDIKLLLLGLTPLFLVSCLFFGTKNGFYDSDDYHGNGSAH
jgi:hypothetical protein